MAVALRHLSRRLLLVSHRTTTKRKSSCPLRPSPAWKFSTTASRLAEESQPDGSLPGATEDEAIQAKRPFTIEDLDETARTAFDRSSPEEQQELRDALKILGEDDSTASSNTISEEMDAEIALEVESLERDQPLRMGDEKLPKNHGGFWADGEDDDFSQVEDQDDDFHDDDMTTVAHAQLDLHRDMRQYQRRIAWDMPLLRSAYLTRPLKPRSLMCEALANRSQNSQSPSILLP